MGPGDVNSNACASKASILPMKLCPHSQMQPSLLGNLMTWIPQLFILKIQFYLFNCVSSHTDVCMHVQLHHGFVEVRSLLVGVISFHAPCESEGWNSVNWHQVCLSAKLCQRPNAWLSSIVL